MILIIDGKGDIKELKPKLEKRLENSIKVLGWGHNVQCLNHKPGLNY